MLYENQFVIETNSLCKTYYPGIGEQNKPALVDLNLKIKKGEIYGFLGQNGAGKTTLIKILIGLIFPTSGNGNLLGYRFGDIRSRQKLGYLPESPYYHTFLTATEYLDILGKLHKLTGKQLKNKIYMLLEKTGLKDASDLKMREFSKGMLQRFGIAQALIGDPELVIFDEPTSGLDPIARKDIRNILIDLKNDNKTVFFSSHILSEVESISDRVGIIQKGKLIKEGTIQELTSLSGYEIRVTNIDTLSLPQLRSYGNTSVQKIDKDFIISFPEIDNNELINYMNLLVKAGARIISAECKKERLEDIFVKLVKEKEE
ncbi:MAG: ABC transporter ATP-binding protein [Candidatus Coatesbacteria bacterium]|nr:ABC transporter ATP-binding protein [Candidatus Coatesbacteria bacterium]